MGTMRGITLDETDLRLLELLQEHGRISQHDLAQAVGLSSPAVGERVRKLEERGVIQGYSAVLDPKKVGRDVTAFITVGIDGSKFYGAFIDAAKECPEVLECFAVTGQGSHLLKVRTENTTSLERLLAQIQMWPGVHWTLSSIVLSTAKETMRLPLLEDGAEAELGS
ncbi:MAG TPA: Lrp/AsnC family transcriptional regulator [Longimicrobiales bacterium]|nr:Lrp/AsnC family transcriptional regulator [Longimicrobiales bacterium]